MSNGLDIEVALQGQKLSQHAEELLAVRESLTKLEDKLDTLTLEVVSSKRVGAAVLSFALVVGSVLGWVADRLLK